MLLYYASNISVHISKDGVCVCVCVCVFIKLHITAQSGPVILAILCHSHRSSQGGINVCVCVYLLNCT